MRQRGDKQNKSEGRKYWMDLRVLSGEGKEEITRSGSWIGRVFEAVVKAQHL